MQTLYPVRSTGSTQEDGKSSQDDCKIVDWDETHQRKQNKKKLCIIKKST